MVRHAKSVFLYICTFVIISGHVVVLSGCGGGGGVYLKTRELSSTVVMQQKGNSKIHSVSIA